MPEVARRIAHPAISQSSTAAIRPSRTTRFAGRKSPCVQSRRGHAGAPRRARRARVSTRRAARPTRAAAAPACSIAAARASADRVADRSRRQRRGGLGRRSPPDAQQRAVQREPHVERVIRQPRGAPRPRSVEPQPGRPSRTPSVASSRGRGTPRRQVRGPAAAPRLGGATLQPGQRDVVRPARAREHLVREPRPSPQDRAAMPSRAPPRRAARRQTTACSPSSDWGATRSDRARRSASRRCRARRDRRSASARSGR